jgi:hypothetical protein
MFLVRRIKCEVATYFFFGEARHKIHGKNYKTWTNNIIPNHLVDNRTANKRTEEMATRLNLGAGTKRKDGYLSVDIYGEPDIKWDLNIGLPTNVWLNAVWMDNSLEHVKNPYKLLSQIYISMYDGGILEIILPNTQWFPLLILGWFVDIHWFWNWWMSLPWKKNRGKHYNLWTPYTIRLTLQTIGFKIIKTKGWYLSKQFYIKAQR